MDSAHLHTARPTPRTVEGSPVSENPTRGPFAATLLPRFQALRVSAAAPAPRETLLLESLEALQTAIEELRVTEEELRSHQEQLADAWHAAETSSDWNRALFDGVADALLVTDDFFATLGMPPAHGRARLSSMRRRLPCGACLTCWRWSGGT